MRLTRRALPDFEAQHRADTATIGRLLAEVQALSDEDSLNARLQRYERHNAFLEADNQRLRDELDVLHGRAADFAAAEVLES